MPKQREEQAAGATTSSEESPDIAEHHHRAHPVGVVFTLTRIPPADPLASTSDARLRSSSEIAKHLPEMDPHGSLVLVEEQVQSSPSQAKKPNAPMVITLNTLASTRVLLPSHPGGDGRGDHVFRVYPQQSLCYGYALQIESNQIVDFQEPSTYWRNVCDVQVVNSDGAYPVLLPNSWNILFKHNVELAAPPTAAATMVADESAVGNHHHHQQQLVELYVDLHLSDPMLGQYVHIAIIDDATSKVTKLSSLCSSVSLPVNSAAHPRQAFTIIVDCAPQDFHVPEGNWHLTLGATGFSREVDLDQFRAPAFAEDTAGGETGGDLSDNLAVKLEVIDSVSEQVLSECFAMKSVRLLQLPRRSQKTNGGGGDDQDDGGGGSDIQTSSPSARPRSSIKWRVNCWSAEDVKLDVDRTKENKFEAIRASWTEAAKDRNSVTNGAVSRLLFLGRTDAAEVKMMHDGVSEDQAKRLRARFEWLEAASAKMDDGVYLEQRVRGSSSGSATERVKMEERMKTVEDFQEEDRLLQAEIGAAQSQLAQKRENRLAARERCVQEVKELVQGIREQRSAALKKRLELWQQRDAILSS